LVISFAFGVVNFFLAEWILVDMMEKIWNSCSNMWHSGMQYDEVTSSSPEMYTLSAYRRIQCDSHHNEGILQLFDPVFKHPFSM
jgi:hypothetical protein